MSGAPTHVSKQDWNRSGARNIAGVSFQVAVTAHLLVDSLGNGLSLARVTPEGFDDIDVEFRDNTKFLVQVKERAPSVRFGRSELAKEIRKKRSLLAEDTARRFALVTDAVLGGGLAQTGWNRTVTECLDPTVVDKLAARLEPDFGDSVGILARTHIVQVARNIALSTRRKIAEFQLVNNQPSVAVLIYARLVENITEIAAHQRSTAPDTAQWITPSDLETLATRVIETVNVETLDEAIQIGIVEAVDFGVRADLSSEDFLTGVDVLPTHIAADLDLLRLQEVQELTDALAEQHSALLTGPSGSGKSALMWRTARELSGRIRPYRLLKLRSGDVPTFARWLRLQEPSEHYPLLLCADNLGRPDMAGWTDFAREFIDRPGVLLLGACREEDFRLGLVVGRTRIVEPTLDRKLAEGIAAALDNRGIQTVVDIAEAFEVSEGLLMEFLSMLLTGRRLKQVIEEQVASRLCEDLRTEREILRYVATTQTAGVAIPSDVLESLLPGHDLIPALAVLHREHLVVTDDGNLYRGLHELRSTVARDYLHQFPPPTTATTVCRLVRCLPVDYACQMIESYAQLDVDLVPTAGAVSEILLSSSVRAVDGLRLVSSLAMADAFRHAQECLKVVENYRPRNLEPWNLLFLVYMHRFGGVSLDKNSAMLQVLTQLKEIAAALPPRPSSLRDTCLQSVSAKALSDIALRGTVTEAAAWLEALEESSAGSDVPVEAIWAHFKSERLDSGAARLISTLRALASDEGSDYLNVVLGPLHDRLHWLANELPDCIGAESKYESDGRIVSLRFLVPEDDSLLNQQSVQTCRMIFGLFPEADIAEVMVLTPSGNRYAVGVVEEGHKRIPRSNLPQEQQTSRNAKFLRAGRLLLASRYWTPLLRVFGKASKQLLKLRKDVVAQLLNPNHNTRRRHHVAKLINSLVTELAALPGEPADQVDQADGSKARQALSDSLNAVYNIVSAESPDFRKKRLLAAQCRGAVKRLVEARQADLPSLSSVGDPLPDDLDEMLLLFADLLLLHVEFHYLPKVSRRKGDAQSLLNAARYSVHEGLKRGYEAERTTLEATLGQEASMEIHRIQHSDFGSVHFLTDWWIVVVPVENDESTSTTLCENMVSKLPKKFEFRTFVVLGSGARILPIFGLKLGANQFWPINGEELMEIAKGLDVEIVNSIHLKACDAFIEELVLTSRAASLARFRMAAGLMSDNQNFEHRFETACRAAEACHPVLRPEAIKLLDRVMHEVSSDVQTFADEYYRLLTHNEQSDDVAAIISLRFAAQSLDLDIQYDC